MSEDTAAPGRGRETARFELDPDVVTQKMGDQLVLVHLETNRIHTLHGTALRLWELLGEGLSRAEIEDRLFSEFDVDAWVLSADVESALGELATARLIVPKGP